jgi:hypothetical protein
MNYEIARLVESFASFQTFITAAAAPALHKFSPGVFFARTLTRPNRPLCRFRAEPAEARPCVK